VGPATADRQPRTSRHGTLRLLFRSLKSGAVIAFLEMEMRSARGYPDAPLFGRCIDWYSAAIELAGFRSNMGSRLLITFQAAGLPTPHVIASSRVEGGPDSPGYDLMAANLRTMLPMLERHKVTTAAEVDLATLAERLRRETVEGQRCLQFPLVMGAHAHAGGKPGALKQSLGRVAVERTLLRESLDLCIGMSEEIVAQVGLGRVAVERTLLRESLDLCIGMSEEIVARVGPGHVQCHGHRRLLSARRQRPRRRASEPPSR
jgi:hypothetical protein